MTTRMHTAVGGGGGFPEEYLPTLIFPRDLVILQSRTPLAEPIARRGKKRGRTSRPCLSTKKKRKKNKLRIACP